MASINQVRNAMSSLRLGVLLRRNFGTATICQAKISELSDPIQQLFLEKLQEYQKEASKLKEGELFDSNPEIEGKKKFGLENLNKRYGESMEEFPKFSFEK